MSTPPLLRTYEEARLLFEAKGWGLAKAAEHLSEMQELKRFKISHPKLSKKTRGKLPIEPEVAAAIEGMKTWGGSERKTEVVTAGLRAIHGDPPIVEVDVRQLARDLRECLPASELALKLVEALEEKAGHRVTRFFQELAGKLTRASWKLVAISAGSGALVALLLVPLLSAHARTVPPPGPLVVVVADAGPDGSPVRFEPGSLLTLSRWGEKVPADQPIPVKLLPGQAAPPCDSYGREEAINAGCWIELGAKPPCHPYFRRGDKCYAPVAADPKKPVGPLP